MPKEPRIIIGIDPGKSGGIAVISLDGTELTAMPDSVRELHEWFDWCKDRRDVLIFMEQVGGFIGTRPADDGGVGDGAKRNLASAHTMFQFGKNVGHIEMAVEAAGLSGTVTLVSPRKWQAAFGIEPKRKGGKETQSQFKRRCREVTEKVTGIPNIRANLADALLIAEYGRQVTSRSSGEKS